MGLGRTWCLSFHTFFVAGSSFLILEAAGWSVWRVPGVPGKFYSTHGFSHGAGSIPRIEKQAGLLFFAGPWATWSAWAVGGRVASALFLRLPRCRRLGLRASSGPHPVMTLPECLHEWPPLEPEHMEEFQQRRVNRPRTAVGGVPASHLKSVCIWRLLRPRPHGQILR